MCIPGEWLKLTLTDFPRRLRKSMIRWNSLSKNGSCTVRNPSSDGYRGGLFVQFVRGPFCQVLALLVASLLPCAAGMADYRRQIQPTLKQYCLGCHSTEKHKGDLDLERFTSLDEVLKHPKVWQGVVEQLSLGEMPPKEKPQPTRRRTRTIARLGERRARRSGAGPRGRSRPGRAAPAEQRRIHLHAPRPDGRRVARSGEGVSGGSRGRRRLHEHRATRW